MKNNEKQITVNAPVIKISRTFKVGTIYHAFTCGKGYTSYKVIARTAKFVTVENLTDGTQKRCKIDLESEKFYVGGYYSTEEVIFPDKKASAITPLDIDYKAMKAAAN